VGLLLSSRVLAVTIAPHCCPLGKPVKRESEGSHDARSSDSTNTRSAMIAATSRRQITKRPGHGGWPRNQLDATAWRFAIAWIGV
jgi:hypothetical protein